MKNLLRQWLLKLRPYLKADPLYLAKGSFWLSASHGLAIVCSLGLYVALAHFMPREAVGTYRYVLSISAIVGSFTLSGLASSISRSAAHGRDGALRQAIKLNIRWGLLLFALSGVAALYYFVRGNELLGWSMLIIGIALPLIDTGDLGIAFTQGKKLFSLQTGLKVARAFVAAVVVSTATILTDNPLPVILAYFVSHAVLTLIALFITLRYVSNQEEDPELKRLSYHTTATQAFAAIADEIDNVFVHHHLSAAALAVYNFAQLIPNNLSGWIKNIGTLAMPKFVGLDHKEAKKHIIHKSLILTGANIVLAAVAALLLPFVMNFFFPQYADAIPYGQVLCISLIFSAAIPLAYLDAHTAIRQKYAISIVSNTVKITVLVAGIYIAGLWGAVIARLITKAFGVSTAFYFALRYQPSSPTPTFPQQTLTATADLEQEPPHSI